MRTISTVVLLSLVACNGKDDSSTDTGTPPDGDLGPARTCDVQFEASKPPGASSFQLAGRFNEWTPQDLQDPDGDGLYSLDLGKLQPGTYGYKLVVDGVWQDIRADELTTWEDGFENQALVVRDCTQPSLTPVSGDAQPDGSLYAEFQFLRAEDGAPLDETSLVATVGDVPVTPSVDRATGLITISATGLAQGKHSVRVSVLDGDGLPPEDGDAYLPLWVEAEPFDWADGVMYFVFTDRFRDGGDDGQGQLVSSVSCDRFWDNPRDLSLQDCGRDYVGGDLVGAKEAIEQGYFQALGVKSLWLSPVYDNPDSAWIGADGRMYSGYHGYWPIDGRTVDPRWGAGGDAHQALEDLVQTAHANGIRIILDGVLNHVHSEHTWLEEHPEWFGAEPCPCTSDPGPCNWDGNPIGCWFTSYLPDLDYKNQAIVDASVDDAIWWLEEFDVDGFRVDAAKHMDHVILRTLSMTLRERVERPGGPEMYLVGETFVGAGSQGVIMDYVADYELDGQFDFPLVRPLRGAMKSGNFRDLANEVRASDAAYGDAVHRMSVFFGNHDIERFTSDLTGCYDNAGSTCNDPLGEGDPGTISDPQWEVLNRVAMAYAFVSTQPGPPLLYYGDEIGLAGGNDPDNRRPMQWNNQTLAQQTLQGRIEGLGQLRTATPALRTGERRELWVDDTLYVYARDNGNGDAAIVALSMGTGARSVPIPADLQLEGASLVNGLTGDRQVQVSGGQLQVDLNPWEYVVWLPAR